MRSVPPERYLMYVKALLKYVHKVHKIYFNH